MSDSDKTNELDNYGVWVKKPPRTVSSETEDTASDIPDFSDIDVVDNSVGVADDTGETEISLDEFIEGGVFEGDEENNSASPGTESAATKEESVPADDFLDSSSDITVSDSPSVSEAPALGDDGPLDIDLSFDDSATQASTSSSASVSSAPVAEVSGSEEVDLSDFGVDFGDDSSSSSVESSSSETVSSDGSEEISLDEFGVDFSDNADTSVPEDKDPQIDDVQVSEDGTEEISLDEFGFDINAEESSSGQESSATEESAPAEEESVPSLSDDSPSLEASDSNDMTVSVDDEESVSIESDSSQEQKSESSSQDFAAPDDDDFDLDSIMDSIEDENGNTSSLNDIPSSAEAESAQEPVIAEESVPMQEDTETAESSDTIDVVDMEEPVFEETSVELPETAEEENPFALPPDDAFASPVSEEPTIIEEPSSEEIALDSVSESKIAGDSESELSDEEPVTEDFNAEEPVEEAISEPVFEDPATTEETVQTEEAAPVKQDTEINAATNNILSQIAQELSSLRGEISTLKNEFEELKNKDSVQVAAPAETQETLAPEEEKFLSEESTDSESNGGFFGADDEDDTIALSLDEMDDILNSVEMVEEGSAEEQTSPAQFEEPVSEESTQSDSLDFSNDNIEEPVLDDIENIEDQTESDLPDEILVPKSDDDILVESSDENLIEEEKEPEVSLDDGTELSSAEDSLTIDEPFVFEDSALESAEDSDDTTLSADELANIASDSIESPSEDEDTTLSADELANIAADSTETEEIADSSEESTIPSVDDILGDISSSENSEDESRVSISEGELDTLLSSEAAKPHVVEEEEEESAPVQSSIPNNLQTEIKSVLSYMDQLLENLPEEKIAEFAQSEQFETYKKLFKELGLN